MESTTQRLNLALLVLLVIIASAVAVPLSRHEGCARHCGESNRFQFLPGTTYTYDYDTSTTTVVKGTSKEKSQLQMRAQVDIEVLSKCELSLRLRGVTLRQTDPQSPDYLSPIKGGRDFSRAVEQQVLKFSWQDGRVEDLCPSDGAPSWVTNIQRGVLSALQNSMENLDKDERIIEPDVAGKCPVEYRSLGRSWRGVLRIHKIKNLNACTHRHNAATSLQATPFTQGSAIQSQPLISGNQECEQSIGDGIIQSSSCVEKHVFRPFSKGDGSVTTTVHQKLTFAASSKRSFTGNDYRPLREGLLFIHEIETEKSTESTGQVETIMKKLCEASMNDITITVPETFASLVYSLKKLDYGSFGSLFRSMDTLCPRNANKAKKFFLDAIPIVATDASVRFMSAMIMQQEISNSETDFWLSSLSFVTEPSPEMIGYLTPLLDGRYEQALLGVSSLVHTFCKETNCSSFPEVRAVVHKLVDNLGENCFNPDVKKILLTLKAIGNIGQPFGRERILERCYNNPQLKMEVRLAAIQSFRRFGCDVSRDRFLKTYSNYNEESEIRIASYLTAMKCMTQETLQEVKETLENEKVNQVGSFVWTHLQAMAKSLHPERQNVKEIVSNLYLLNKYHSDIRKFSSAHEASFYLDSINSGLHVDTHLIFPTHSYLPHSATVNLTVDIFGHSCNLLQLDGRMEGMEHIMERFFGPSGHFPQKHVSKLLRERRSISDNKINRMDAQFDAKSKFEEKPYGSLDVKIFGNTLWYNQFEENDKGQTASNLMDIVAELAQKQEMEFSRSFMFLDTTYSIPMASGLPLRLAVNGTANVNLKLGGRFNVRSLQSVDVLAHVEPSGAVRLAGLLTVEAGNVGRTGLRVAATLHSSTVLDTKFEVRNGEIIKAEVNVPRERIDVVDLQTHLYLVYGQDEREFQGQVENGFRMNSCIPGDSVKRIFGVEFCTDVQLPGSKSNTPMYPMNGPSIVSLYLKKVDPSLTKYTFDAAWENKIMNGQSVRQGSISFNTPQSSIDREVKMHFLLNQLDGIFTFEAKTPLRRMGVKAKYINTLELKKLDVSLSVDDKDRFSMHSELRAKAEKGSISYFPTFEVSIPSRKLITIGGSAHLKYRQKYSGQLMIQDVTEKPIVLKGSLDMKERNRLESEISISSYALDTTVKAYGQNGDTMFTKISADYKIMDGKTYKISINGKVRDLSAHALRKYTGVLNMQATAFPEWDTSVSWETMQTTGHLENTFSFTIGDGVKTRAHTINFQEIVKYRGGIYDNNAEVTLKLTYPEKNLNYALQMKHENTEYTLKNSLEIQYALNRQVLTTVEYAYEPGRSLNGECTLKYPGRDAKITVELSENKPREYKGSTTIQWQQGKKISLTTHYRDRSDGSRTKHEAEVDMILPYRPPVSLSGSFGVHREEYTAFVEVNNGLEKYRVNADFVKGKSLEHRFSGMLLLPGDSYSVEESLQSGREKMTGILELKLGTRRRVSTKFEVKNSKFLKTGYFETSWDADRDQSKKIGFNGELRMNSNGYDTKFTMQLQRRNIKGSISTNSEGQLYGNYFKAVHQAEIEWTPRRKASFSFNTNMLNDDSRRQLNSKIELVTPYPGYEESTLSVSHSNTNQEWNSDMLIAWNEGKRFSISSGGKYSLNPENTFLDANFKLHNPWFRHELLSLNISHYHDTFQLSNNMQLEWSPRGRIVTELSRFITETGFKGKVKVMTPFRNAHDLHAEINHNYVSGVHKTKLDVQWENRRKISAELDLKHVLSGRRRICSTNIVVSTPFDSFEYVSSKVVYNGDGTTENADGEIHWNNKKITMGAMKTNRNSYYNKNMEGKIYFTSPFNGYTDLQLVSSLQMTPDNFKVNLDTKLPFEMSTTFNSVGKFMSWQNFELNAAVNSQFNNYINFERFSVDFAQKYQNSNARSSFEGIYNNKQITILFTGMMKPGYRSQNIEGSLSAKTPFNGYQEVSVDVSHNRREWEWTTKVQVKRNRKGFNLIHNASVKDSLNFETSLVLSSVTRGSPANNFKYSAVQMFNEGYLSHVSIAEWGSQKTELNVRYDDKLSGKELKVELASPFESLRKFDLNAYHDSGRRDYKTKIVAQWNGNRKISLDNKITNSEFKRLDAELDITSNLNGHQQYVLLTKYDLTNSKKTADLSYRWIEGKEKTVSLTGSYLVGSSPELKIGLMTPFKDMERITFVGRADNMPREKELTITFEKNRVKTEAKGKLRISAVSGICEASFTSPFRYARFLQASARYQNSNSELYREIFVQWDEDKKISAIGKLNQKEKGFDIKLTLSTPFSNYEALSVDMGTNLSNQKRTAELILRRNEDKIEVTTECLTVKGREGKFKVQFLSPFYNVRKISAEGSYKREYDEFQAYLNLNAGKERTYEAEIQVSNKEKLYIRLKTPRYPYRTIELETELKNEQDHHELKSQLKWEERKIEVYIMHKIEARNKHLLQFKVTTPYESFKSFSAEGSLLNKDFKWMKGNVEITTPFKSLPKLTVSGEYKVDDEFYDFKCEVTIHRKTSLIVSGQMTNNPRKPFQASLNINAPFARIDDIVLKTKVDDTKGWTNTNAEFTFATPRSEHTLTVSYVLKNDHFFTVLNINSPFLSGRRMDIKTRANFGDTRNMNAFIGCEIFGREHNLEVKYKQERYESTFEAKIFSPALPQGKADVRVNYIQRHRMVNCEFTIEFPDSRHSLIATAETDRTQSIASLKIKCGLLAPTPIEVTGKYVNGNGKDMELLLNAVTPGAKHTIAAILKNYNGNKLFEVQVECPLLKAKRLSVTGTLKNDGFNVVDGVLTLNAERKEIRIAGNMKRSGWRNVEGFLIFNTPFEQLRMLRIDTGFRNDDFKDVEANLQIETSNPSMPNLGFTGKISRGFGSEDLSLVMHLPGYRYSTVQFLGNLHYEPDFSSANSKITLSLSPYRYSMYGRYQAQNSELSLDGELEYEEKKFAFSSQTKIHGDMKGATINIQLPGKGSYTAGAAVSGVGGRRSLSVSYGDPYSSPLNVSVAIDYVSSSNINVALRATTPFEGLNRINARVRHQRNGKRLFFTDVEYSTDGQQGFFNLLHRMNHTNYLCTVRMGSPFKALKDFEITYLVDHNHESRIDVIHNGYKYLKSEMSSNRGVKNYILELPFLPMIVSSKLSPTNSGQELTIRSKYPTRTMSLNVVQQETSSFLSQDVVFVWDESTHRQMSYSFKLSNSPKGQPWGKELFTKLNFPLRSLEFRGKLTESGKVRSGGMDFYWDANRDTAKHLALGVEHQDVSTRAQTSHKLQFTLIHPTLPKDLEINNVLTVSATEFLCRSELQYSRHQERHLVAELKANNLLPRQRDSHYRAEMSLRHPISQLDIRVSAEVIDNAAESMAEIRLNNMDRKSRTTVHELKAKIYKMKQQIDIMMRSNEDRMSILGKKVDRDGETIISLKQKINGLPALQSYVRVDRGLRSVDLNISYAEIKGMKMGASYQHNEATFRLQHFDDISTFTDVSAYLGLERSRILKSKASWKPGIWRDMRIATGDNLRGLSYSMSKEIQDLTTEISKEYNHHVQRVGRELSSKLQPFWSSISRDMDGLRRDIIATSHMLNTMYENNEFFSKDIVNGIYVTRKVLRDFWDVATLFSQMLSDLTMNYIEEMFENLYYNLEDFAVYIGDTYSAAVSGLSKWSKRISSMFKECFSNICDASVRGFRKMGSKLSDMAERTRKSMELYLHQYAPCIIDAYYYIRITTDNIRNDMKNALASVTTAIRTHPLYVAVNDYFLRVVTTIRTFQTSDLLFSVQSRVLFLGEKANVFLRKLSDTQVVDLIRDQIPVDYLAETAKQTLQKGAELYNALGVDKIVKGILYYSWEHAKSLALSSGQEMLYEFYQLKTGAKYSLDTKRGSFSFEYTLPTSKNSIYEVFQLAQYPEYRKLSELKKMLVTKYYEDFCVWDLYYKVKNFFSPKYWMPPFTAHAMIAGNQHYVTFDKLAFDFAGECSYLLARDFVDGNFTIVANYKREHSKSIRKSLTIQLDNNKFEIVNDYRLSLNGVKVEMPIRVGRTVATRRGANVRIENDYKGFVVVCNFVHDVCTVGMSGFYFGKTGGLFGTYDYEPYLDMMTPEKSLASDVEAFVNSWEVGQTTCRSSSNLATIPGNDLRVQEKCKAIFAKTSSPFRACFKQVDPESYLKMCINDLSSVHEDQFESTICTSAAAYFTECKVENVQLKMPKTCVRCETTNERQMIEGDVAKFTRDNPTHAADVVFVVEEKKCNEENFKYLMKLAHIIDDNFRQKGFLDIRYRVVGFGGPDIHARPHIHTMNGQEYGNIRSVEMAIQSLLVGEGPVNMLEALRFAAAMDFRPGTSKNFVLLKCSTCKSEEGKAEYGEMLRTLQDGDINLHLLMEQKYEMRIANKNSKAKKVIGLDKNFAYTLKDIKDSNVFGDGDLLVQLKVPKDICIPLALEVNGSTFDSQYLTETKRNTYKKFMDVLARRMVKSAMQTPPSGALCCECIATEEGVGKSTCQRCVSAHVARMMTDDSTVYYTPNGYNRE